MAETRRVLRMGAVGGGQGAFIGAVHRMAARLDGHIELVAGCFSRDPGNTRATGAELRLDPSRCYSSYGEMAEAEAARPDGERIDFVTIATPNVSHFAIAEAFLRRGVHVVCDKPMTHSLEEAGALERLVEETGLVFALTHNYTGYPMIRQARAMCREGKLGAIRKVLIEYLQDFFVYPHEKEGQKQAVWRTDPAQAGQGGTLADCGSHCVNLLEYVTGDSVAELCADKSTYMPGRVLDEDVNILLRMRGGGKGAMTLSQIATGEENALRLRIYGAEGSILWDQENPNYLKYYRYNEPRMELTRGHGEYLSPAASACTRFPTGHPEGFLEAFATIYCGVAEAIHRHLEGNPMGMDEYDFPTVRDGVSEMRFIAKAVESAGRGSVWVTL